MAKKDRTTRNTPLNHDPSAVVWARTAKGWSQSQLASEVGVSQGHFSEIEKGTRSATPGLLIKIAKALNCPVSVLERKRVAA